MSNLTILGRIEDFSRNDDVFELKVDNKIFIKHKHNNSVFLYSKNSYQKDLKYTVQAKYEYAGFYNLVAIFLFSYIPKLINSYIVEFNFGIMVLISICFSMTPAPKATAATAAASPSV